MCSNPAASMHWNFTKLFQSPTTAPVSNIKCQTGICLHSAWFCLFHPQRAIVTSVKMNIYSSHSVLCCVCTLAYKVYFVLLYVRSKHKHDGRPIQMRWCVFYTVWRFYTTFSLLNSNPKIIVTQTIKQKNFY